MKIDVHGQPLHSRSLTVTIAQLGDRKLGVDGTLVDVRKTGLVPVAAKLGTPGIVHLMKLHGVVDPMTMVLETLRVDQPVVAFEASALTTGESCRDPNGRVEAIAGTRLDEGYARGLNAEIGGALGCSHILTLAHLLGGTVAWALGPGGVRGTDPERAAGEPVFRRDVNVDGHRPAADRLEFAVQMTDLSYAPAPPIARPTDRLAAIREVRILAKIALGEIAFTELAAGERYRTAATLDDAAWVDRSDRVASAAGLSPFRGITVQLLDRLGGEEADRPLLDALLMVAPTFIQVCGVLSDDWPARAQRTDSIIGMGGLPDACYMWRRGGALDRARGPSDPPPTW